MARVTRVTIGALLGAALVLGFLSSPAVAAVELDGNTLRLTSPTLTITFEGGAIASIRNRITGEEYLKSSPAVWVNLRHLDGNNGEYQPGEWRLTTEGESGAQLAMLVFSGSRGQIDLTAGVDAETDEIFLRFRGSSATPGVTSVFWGLQGLNLMPGRLVIPGQAGTFFDRQSTPDRVGLDYPIHWEAQMVVYEGEAGGLLIYARDPLPHFKRLLASRETGNLDFGFEVFAVAPWKTATETPEIEWRLRAFEGDWLTGARIYKTWMRSVWPLRNPDEEPAWVDDIRIIATVFNPDTRILDRLAELLIPSRTLVYLVDWRRYPFDVNYPDYEPRGEARLFVEHAHKLGFRVMLHTNALGVSPRNPDFARVRQFQIKRPDNLTPVTWPFGLWPDNNPPPGLPSFAFISPASSAYRDLFVDHIRLAVESLAPDALHLDAGGLMLNDGNGLIEGHNTTEGLILLYWRILEEFPDLVLGSESITEALSPLNRFVQRWPADSPAHPISSFLLEERILSYGFLDQAHPEDPEFPRFVRRYEGQGVLPGLIIRDLEDLDDDRPGMSRLIKFARAWQEHDFVPDWEGDWTGVAYLYRSASGDTTAAVREEGNIRWFTIDGRVLYRHVCCTAKLDAPYRIPGWPAYDSNAYYGLDAQKVYWLEENVLPTDPVHLSGLPKSIQIGERSFTTPEFGFFDLELRAPESYDFFAEFPDAAKGTIYARRDFPLANGSLAIVTRAFVAGKLQSPVLLMVPPFRRMLRGATFVEYTVPVPDAARVTFRFRTALRDSSTRSDGIGVLVRVNGDTVWQTLIDSPGQWHEGSIDLTAWRGQRIALRLITYAGNRFDPRDDFVVWSDLRLDLELSRKPVQVTVHTPAAQPPAAVSGGTLVGQPSAPQCSSLPPSELLPGGEWDSSEPGDFLDPDPTLDSCDAPPPPPEEFTVTVSAPNILTVFTRPPALVTPGDDLRDLLYTTWRVIPGGLPQPIRVQHSGEIATVISGGIAVERAIIARPPADGQTMIAWAVQLPDSAIGLRIRFGLEDPPPPLPPDVAYTGVRFAVVVNGTEVFQRPVEGSGWQEATVALNKWRGQPVVIQLVTDSQEDPTFDWACWADFTLIEGP